MCGKNKMIMFLDIETTGKVFGVHEIIEIGAQAFDLTNLEVVGEYRSLLRPKFWNNIDPSAMKVNGIKKEDLERAPYAHIVMGEIIEWWENVLGMEKFIPAGQNYGGFDKIFIKTLFGKFYDEMFDYHSLDTWSLAYTLQHLGKLPSDLKLSLKDLCEHFDIVSVDHKALVDSRNSKEVFLKMIGLMRED